MYLHPYLHTFNAFLLVERVSMHRKIIFKYLKMNTFTASAVSFEHGLGRGNKHSLRQFGLKLI